MTCQQAKINRANHRNMLYCDVTALDEQSIEEDKKLAKRYWWKIFHMQNIADEEKKRAMERIKWNRWQPWTCLIEEHCEKTSNRQIASIVGDRMDNDKNCTHTHTCYTLSHRENDRDLSTHSRGRRLLSRAQLVCLLTSSKRNTGIGA